MDITLYLQERYKVPLYLPDKEEMTKEEFFEFCVANKHLHIERDEQNQILIMAPAGAEFGSRHIKIAFEEWNRKTN